MIDKPKYLNLNSMNHILSEIKRCDVILRCGKEKYIGLTYDSNVADSPIVACKGEFDYNYYLMKAGETLGVPCVEHKILARELFNKLEIGDIVPPEFYSMLATVYSHLEKFKNREERDDFRERQNRDLGNQLYSFEKKHYKKIIRKTLKKNDLQQKVYEGDVVTLFDDELKNLSEKYELNYRTYHNAAFKTDEFYLESFIEKYNLEFWQMVFISKEDRKIVIGTRHSFESFDFSDCVLALEVFKALVDECNTDIRKTAIEYCEDKSTNPKLCKIVEDSIRTMLRQNYKECGIEYGFYCDSVISAVYLRPVNSSVMYEILILHNDFLKQPQKFREAIKDPKSINNKEITCRKKKYNQKFLDEKFQTIEQ